MNSNVMVATVEVAERGSEAADQSAAMLARPGNSSANTALAALASIAEVASGSQRVFRVFWACVCAAPRTRKVNRVAVWKANVQANEPVTRQASALQELEMKTESLAVSVSVVVVERDQQQDCAVAVAEVLAVIERVCMKKGMKVHPRNGVVCFRIQQDKQQEGQRKTQKQSVWIHSVFVVVVGAVVDAVPTVVAMLLAAVVVVVVAVFAIAVLALVPALVVVFPFPWAEGQGMHVHVLGDRQIDRWKRAHAQALYSCVCVRACLCVSLCVCESVHEHECMSNVCVCCVPQAGSGSQQHSVRAIVALAFVFDSVR